MLKWIVILILVLLCAAGLVLLAGSQLPVRHTVSRTAQFQQSPQQVWDVISGPPTWRPDVERYEELPAQPGHRKWVEYGAHGQKITYEMVEANPPDKLVTRIADPALPFRGSWTYDIAPSANGSTLTITEYGEIYNPLFRLVSRYIMGYTATIDNYLKALRAKLDAGS